MHSNDRVLDSYQNEVVLGGRESVEAISTDTEADDINIQRDADADPYAEAAVTYASDGMWDTDEDAERVVTPRWRTRMRDAQGRWIKA